MYYLAWIISTVIQWNYEITKIWRWTNSPCKNNFLRLFVRCIFALTENAVDRRHYMYIDLIVTAVTITTIIVFRWPMKLYCCAMPRRTLEFALRSAGMPELHWPSRRTNVRALRTEMAESRRRIKRTGHSVRRKWEIVKAFYYSIKMLQEHAS